jgi:hypothetical protein
MNASMRQLKQSGRTRVMIVDPGWHVGLKLADCLATEGYHAVLVRDLESILTELGEIQPEAILFSPDSCDDEHPSLRSIQSLCPEASVLSLLEPLEAVTVLPTTPTDASQKVPNPFQSQPVENYLRARLGMPCVRIQ